MENRYTTSPIRAFAILAGSIFAVELTIMIIFLLLPPLPPVAETMADAVLLTILVSPIIYRFAFLPLNQQIAELNKFARNYEDLNQSLEQRVTERTTELKYRAGLQEEQSKELEAVNKQVRRRATQFEALAQVTQTITAIRELQQLLPRITSVISEKFGFYHVGIFLLDEINQFAILSATNSEGGKRLLARSHRLRVG